MHPGQLVVDVATVRRMVGQQFPQWSGLPVGAVRSSATVNHVFRIGKALAARFPMRPEDPTTVLTGLRAEAAAMRGLAAATALPTPAPVAIGQPGDRFPMPWSVQTWVPGRDATVTDPAGSAAFAQDLAELLGTLRAADTGGRRFTGAGRGGHLPDHDAWVATCLRESEGLLDVSRLAALWKELRELPEVDGDVMCHGDLTPPNLLVGRRGSSGARLVGVLDGGGFGPADPALDLVVVWHLLDRPGRRAVRAELGCGPVQWQRGRAWAFQQAMGLVWYYAETNPTMSRWGRRTLERVLEPA